MQHVLPAARGLRTFYTLASDKLWFALAVVACMLLAGQVAELMILNSIPNLEPGFGL